MLQHHDHIPLTLLPNGMIALPPDALEVLSVVPGDTIFLERHSAGLTLHSEKLQAERIHSLREIQASMREFVPPNASLVDELIAERREEARREAKKYERCYTIPLEAEKP